KKSYEGIHEAPFPMAFPLVILGIGSLLSGFLGKELMVGLGTPFWQNAIINVPTHNTGLEAEYIDQSIKHLPFVLTCIGGFLGLTVNSPAMSSLVYKMKLTAIGKTAYTFLNRRWLFDKVYNDYIGRPALSFGYNVSFKSIDKGVLEILGPFGITQGIRDIVHQIQHLQSGFIYHYAFVMLLGLTFLLTLLSLENLIDMWVDPRLWCVFGLAFMSYFLSEKTTEDEDEILG
ncbi:MAG: hypothetical protein CMP20_17510, partial [Rickettsiales bacterium]|nr:hypothetical protein [Rickettsiales bacterium]